MDIADTRIQVATINEADGEKQQVGGFRVECLSDGVSDISTAGGLWAGISYAG
jgi:hypothetical protein